ncbi:MAG TPA: bifunctional ornithine acetyltransferase/N-acetylglutamate synthase, partial [Promineifilum sp.]
MNPPQTLGGITDNMAQYRTIDEGGVTSPRGFTAAAVAAGIKESGRPDLALVVSEHDCAAAAVFTSNRVAAAPVLIDRETLEQGNTSIRGVVINAGNANACTGAPGLAGARESQRLMAEAIGTRPDQILLMSTGVIGVPLPMDRMRAGITAALPTLAVSSGLAAAEAIMTTDTRPKHLAIELDLPDGRVVLGGMAKGAGMIHPDMATMLCLITTDAAVSADDLQNALRNAVAVSFNAISVDGDTSTNDTVLLLANGASGVRIADGESRLLFADALNALCYELAMMIVADGEGA